MTPQLPYSVIGCMCGDPATGLRVAVDHRDVRDPGHSKGASQGVYNGLSQGTLQTPPSRGGGYTETPLRDPRETPQHRRYRGRYSNSLSQGGREACELLRGVVSKHGDHLGCGCKSEAYVTKAGIRDMTTIARRRDNSRSNERILPPILAGIGPGRRSHPPVETPQASTGRASLSGDSRNSGLRDPGYIPVAVSDHSPRGNRGTLDPTHNFSPKILGVVA